jgi:hypothetical protein
VLLSAFVDNIPYTATMLPVVAVISPNADGGGNARQPEAALLRTACRSDARRQPYSDRSVGEHRGHRHPSQRGVRGQIGRVYEVRHSDHAFGGHNGVSFRLGAVVVNIKLQKRRAAPVFFHILISFCL